MFDLQKIVDYLNGDLALHGIEGYRVDPGKVQAAIEGINGPKRAGELLRELLSCPTCGCTDVQWTAWVYANTGLDCGDEGPTDQAYCPQCENNGHDGMTRTGDLFERTTTEPLPCRLRSTEGLLAMIEGDRIDARAMAAIEVHKERRHRNSKRQPSPRSIVDFFGDSKLREFIERENGEPLL